MQLDDVAKARILITMEGERWYLLARKRADGASKHNKLEMLGGHLEVHEAPFAALVRELSEEEATGKLADFVRDHPVEYRQAKAGGAMHYLFQIEISQELHKELRADMEESLGFELVRESELDDGQHDSQLTPRTRKILEEFGRADQGTS